MTTSKNRQKNGKRIPAIQQNIGQNSQLQSNPDWKKFIAITIPVENRFQINQTLISLFQSNLEKKFQADLDVIFSPDPD